MNVQIDGLGNVYTSRNEYTSAELKKQYLEALDIIENILNQKEPLSEEDVENLEENWKKLVELAQKGETSGNPPTTSYMTTPMMLNAVAIIESLKSAGMSLDNPSTINQTNLSSWISNKGYGVQSILANAIMNAGSSTRSLQSMIELEFVRAGNEQVARKMQALSDALKVAQAALDNLGVVQGISNQIGVKPSEDYSWPPETANDIPSGGIYDISYYLNTKYKDGSYPPFDIIFPGDETGEYTIKKGSYSNLGDALYKVYTYEQILAGQDTVNDPSLSLEDAMKRYTGSSQLIAYALSTTPTSGSTIEVDANLQKLIGDAHFKEVSPTPNPTAEAANELLAARDEMMKQIAEMERLGICYASTENSLAYFMQKVVNDIDSYFEDIPPYDAANPEAYQDALKNAVSNWIMDGQNQAGGSAGNTAGAIQDRINQAINAAESLNDTEKQKVTQANYEMQQFYQAAGTILDKITQIIEKMAQGMKS